MIGKYSWLRVMALQFLLFPGLPTIAQHISDGYEVRYFSKDPSANGETDFKGETSTLDNEKRIEFLKFYADEVSSYYGDQDLNTQVVTDQEAIDFLGTIKAQPLPTLRKRINLEQWKWLSYRAGQHEASIWEIDKFSGAENMLIKDGAL